MSVLTYKTVAAMVAGVFLAACAPVPSTSPVTPTAPSSGVSPSAVVRSSAEQECGTVVPPTVAISDATVRTVDHVQLHAAILGDGSQGVVLLHQTDNGLCGWLPYAAHLADQGYQVAVFDRRCTFGSTCVPEPDAYNFIADVDAVSTALRRRGAAGIAIVGASFGGAVAIGACATVRASACAALSPAQFDNYLGGSADTDRAGADTAVTANSAISRVRTPLLVAVAPDDPDSPADTVAALTRRGRPSAVTTVALPVGAGHGWDTVLDPVSGQPTPFSARLTEFLDDHRSDR